MKINFVIADIWTSHLILQNEGEYVRYKKRVVQIELTQDQMDKLELRKVGQKGKEDIFEEIIDCFIDTVMKGVGKEDE